MAPVKLPNGRVVYNVPEGITKAELQRRLIAAGEATEDDFLTPEQLQDKKTQQAIWRGEIPASGEPPEMRGGGYLSSLAGQTLQGTLASWGDEVTAAAAAGIEQARAGLGFEGVNVREGESLIDTYRRIRGEVRARNQAFREEHPATSLAANVAGGMIPLSKGMKAIEEGAAGIMGMTALGSGWGMADYLGELENYSDFEILAAAGRAGLGAAIPLTLAGTPGVWHWLKNREVDEVAGILEELRRHAGKSADELTTAAKEMGPSASLVDVTGDVGVAYGQAAKQVGGLDVANTVEKNLKGKLAIAKKSIRDMMQFATGKRQFSYYDTLRELVEARKARANELYGAALDKGNIRATPRMLAIMNQNPTVREAWERVQDIYARNNLRLPELFDQDDTGKIIGVMKDGKLTGRGQFPNMRAVQEMKFEMDKMYNTLSGSVDSAGKMQFNRFRQDRLEFLDEVYRQNPMFKQANEMFAGDIALEGAQMVGRKHGLGKLNVEEQLDYIRSLNPSEKDAYLQGVMSDVYNTLGRSREDLITGANRLVTENSQRTLEALIGKKATKAIMKEFQTGRRFAEVNAKLREGSQTAPRTAAGESFQNRLRTANMEDLKGISPTNKVGNWVLDKLPRKYGKLEAHDIDVLANLMTQKGGVEMAVARMRNHGLNPYEIQEYIRLMSAAGVALQAAGGEEIVSRTPIDANPYGLMQP